MRSCVVIVALVLVATLEAYTLNRKRDFNNLLQRALEQDIAREFKLVHELRELLEGSNNRGYRGKGSGSNSKESKSKESKETCTIVEEDDGWFCPSLENTCVAKENFCENCPHPSESKECKEPKTECTVTVDGVEADGWECPFQNDACVARDSFCENCQDPNDPKECKTESVRDYQLVHALRELLQRGDDSTSKESKSKESKETCTDANGAEGWECPFQNDACFAKDSFCQNCQDPSNPKECNGVQGNAARELMHSLRELLGRQDLPPKESKSDSVSTEEIAARQGPSSESKGDSLSTEEVQLVHSLRELLGRQDLLPKESKSDSVSTEEIAARQGPSSESKGNSVSTEEVELRELLDSLLW